MKTCSLIPVPRPLPGTSFQPTIAGLYTWLLLPSLCQHSAYYTRDIRLLTHNNGRLWQRRSANWKKKYIVHSSSITVGLSLYDSKGRMTQCQCKANESLRETRPSAVLLFGAKCIIRIICQSCASYACVLRCPEQCYDCKAVSRCHSPNTQNRA